MKLHAIILLAGVFLTHNARGKPQSDELLVARGANVYGAGGGFNPGPFPAVPRQQQQQLNQAFRRDRQEQPLIQQLHQPAPAAPAPAPAPARVEIARQVSGGGVRGVPRQPDRQPTPLEEIDLRVTDLTTGGRQPPIGSNDLGPGPSAELSPPTPLVIGSSGGAGSRPSLDSVLEGLPPPASSTGGEIGAGVISRQAVVGFERNSAQAGGEADSVPLSAAPSYDSFSQQQQQQAVVRRQEQRVVARGGDTYGAGQTVEVPRVSGDLDIRPEQPRTKEDVLSQAALPDAEPPSQPTAGVRALPPPRDADSGEGHHMGGIEWLPESIPGEPLVDYPVLSRMPETGFDCANQEYDGFFADTSEDARCQAFWVCHNQQQDGFLCPNGTMFNQRYFTCDWWFNVRCPESPDYYELNKNIGVVGTRIDTLPAGVVGAESKVHPVFTLLSKMLHYPRVPPMQLHNLLKKHHSNLSSTPKPAEDYKSSVRVMEKIQDRQASKVKHLRPKTSKLIKSRLAELAGPSPQFNMKSHKMAVNERSNRDRRMSSRRRRRHRKRSGRHRSRSAREPPAASQNPLNAFQQSAPGNQAKNQSSESATPEPYIETIQKVDLPMSKSGSPKLMDDVTIMEKESNITLSQAEKQIPLSFPASSGAAKTPPGWAQDQSPAQDYSAGQAPPVSPRGSPRDVRSDQGGVPNAAPPGSPPISPQGQPPGSPIPGQPPVQPAGNPAGQTPVQRPVQPQDQPPPQQGAAQPAAASGSGQQTGTDGGFVIDEDVKVEEGGNAAPVEKKLHFPPVPGTAQSGNQAPASSGSNSTNGTDANGVSIDEDIKVIEGNSAHPVEEEELRYPPGGKPTVVEGSAKSASSHPGAAGSPNSTLNNPANLQDPSALHHDMPSENAPLDEMPKTKAPPTDEKTQVGDKVQITSETVSKVVQNPKTPTVRDPSGLQPPKSDKLPGLGRKKSSGQKRESIRSEKLAKDFAMDESDASTNDEKSYPEVRIMGNLQPLPKASLPSKVEKTVSAIDETLRLQPKNSEQSKTYDAGTFYLSPSKNGGNGAGSPTSSKNPIGVNLKIFVNQKPVTSASPNDAVNAANPDGASPKVAVAQTPASTKNRRMVRPEVPAVEDAYDYDLSELPSWMQRAAAVKRGAGFPSSPAELSWHDPADRGAAFEDVQIPVSLSGAPRPVRTAGVHMPDTQSTDMKRVLSAPRVQKIFRSAREKLMKLLGGPQETLDSEIDSLLGKRQSDKGKRQNDMKLRLDSSSLTSYPT